MMGPTQERTERKRERERERVEAISGRHALATRARFPSPPLETALGTLIPFNQTAAVAARHRVCYSLREALFVRALLKKKEAEIA